MVNWDLEEYKNAKADADFLPNPTPTSKKFRIYLTDESEFNRDNNSKILRKQTLSQSRKNPQHLKEGLSKG